MDRETLVLELYKHNIFVFGDFKLKSGDYSPFYIDLRIIPSYPHLFKQVIQQYSQLLHQLPDEVGAVAGIMSAGIPFATGLTLLENLPLLQIRKESKSYGTKKSVEGKYLGNKKVVVIDDLISTGASKLPALQMLKEYGFEIGPVLVFIDRTRPDVDIPFEVLSVFKISDILTILSKYPSEVLSKDVQKLDEAIQLWES